MLSVALIDFVLFCNAKLQCVLQNSTTIPCSVEHWASIDISADFVGEKYMFIDLDLYLYSLHSVYRGVRVIKLAIHLEFCYVDVVHIKIAWKHSESCSCIKHTQRFLYFPLRTFPRIVYIHLQVN